MSIESFNARVPEERNVWQTFDKWQPELNPSQEEKYPRNTTDLKIRLMWSRQLSASSM